MVRRLLWKRGMERIVVSYHPRGNKVVGHAHSIIINQLRWICATAGRDLCCLWWLERQLSHLFTHILPTSLLLPLLWMNSIHIRSWLMSIYSSQSTCVRVNWSEYTCIQTRPYSSIKQSVTVLACKNTESTTMQSLAIDELNSIHISLALLACKNKVNLHPVVMWPLWIFYIKFSRKILTNRTMVKRQQHNPQHLPLLSVYIVITTL
jgi:hypothetical protein